MVVFISICCAAYLFLLGMKAVLAIVQVADDPVNDEEKLPSGILTLMQPILSGDPRLEEMLEGNLLSLPGQRFLWLCDAWDHEAIRITELLKQKYPAHQIVMRLCPDCPERVNPKVFKLIEGTSDVTTPYFAVLDDDTHLPAATAADLVRHARKDTVATALPCYDADDRFSGSLLSQFVNNNSAMTYLPLLPFCRPISINGMCYVMKASGLGMFPGIAHHLTDDLALAGAVKESGDTIYQSCQPVRLKTDISGFRHYLRMMHRWYLFALLLLKGQGGGYKAAILALHGWHPLVLWMMMAGVIISPSVGMFSVAGIFLLLRGAMLVLLQGKVFGRSIHRPLASLVSEWLQPVHLVHAVLNRNITWRSRKYRVCSSEHFEANE